MITYLDELLMQEMCHRLAVVFFNKTEEPIPEFSNHNTHLLRSALNLPKATFNKRDLYPNLVDKGAILFYALVKNHPFPNGNKRIATATLLVFFYINDHWISSSQDALYNRAIIVANSDPKEKEKTVADLKKWLKKHLIKESESGRFRKILMGFWQALVIRMRGKKRGGGGSVPVIEMQNKE